MTTEDAATDDAPRRNKPRLAIKKMVLENFKSYAGAQHVGPFHKVS
jgi:structural maintenance of chromosome 4